MKNMKTNTFWTIWALGWHRIVGYHGRTIELKIFIGPVVITMW